ncbi:MAG: helicase-related protein [Pyrinomonadaceae bacterium]
MRNQILDLLRRELVGPDPDPPSVQPDGEEILESDPPTIRYGAGVLFPQGAPVVEATIEDSVDAELNSDDDLDSDSSADETGSTAEESGGATLVVSGDEETEEPVGLANSFKPSAMGISFLVEIPNESGISIEVNAGNYKTITKEIDGRSKRHYYRKSITSEIILTTEQLTGIGVKTLSEPVIDKTGATTKLELFVLSRPEKNDIGHAERRLITISLINKNKSTGRVSSEDCFFQSSFRVTSSDGKSRFIEYPENRGERLDDEEKVLKLLYRHRKTFAVGHGCAADWEEKHNGDAAESVSTSVLPFYDVKPIQAATFDEVSLSMLEFSDLHPEINPLSSIRDLCDKYEEWISEQQKEIPSLDIDLQGAATANLENCNLCLRRMRKGADVIETDERAMKAFRLMNRAMLLQQLHYSMSLREWRKDSSGAPVLPDVLFPDVSGDLDGKGTWRPFQLAFILINIASLVDPFDDDRNIADLIWFPTGGGKTEAYLGLTALTVFLRRLKDPNNVGVTVLMRYTLRLLTTQQFQRAAALICACEIIRKEQEKDLGMERISIGLWVGAGLTPNQREVAIKKLNKISRGEEKINPFVLLKCPWCSAQVGITKECGVKGYESYGTPKTISFVCPDSACPFSAKSFPLPLYVIDEDIYERKPSLVIGTVDKFAMLPWKKEIKSLFGKDGASHGPPELIIQDELHLISGPLGSMVGHYETVIDEFCTSVADGKRIRPKIIASTATIRRAEEQVAALFNRKVFQFPPQALRAGDSFFARENIKAEGRLYVGVHASALSSHVTTQVRVFAALLQAVLIVDTPDEAQRDFYYTMLCYFNNLRELGHAATLIHADIPQYMQTTLWKKNYVPSDRRRFINRDLELTSRENSARITKALQDLERKFGSAEKAIDICLATNMVSVGVDISRLGLMVMVGQPKTTSEYIQATSRVGRDKDGPGLVVTIYNTGKPRDRSHYEHFRAYHSTLYKQVEPTSVTPWAIPVRKRALHALMVSIIRLLGSEENAASPKPYPDDEIIQTAYRIIEDRVNAIDPDEALDTLTEAEAFMKKWKRLGPKKYGSFGLQDEAAPLMYPAGKFPLPIWDGRAEVTPSSMRSVDKTCQTIVANDYPKPTDEDSEF